jgi:hypothetical protein
MSWLQSYTKKRKSSKIFAARYDFQWKWTLLMIEAYILRKTRQLSSGQLVQIMDGPFIALEAVFMREMPGHQRAMLRTLAFRYGLCCR